MEGRRVAEIHHRLDCRPRRHLPPAVPGEKVRYDGPAGAYPSLRLNDLPDQLVPPLVFAAIGSNGLELAGRHFDGVLLHPFLTTTAVRRSVELVRGAERAAGGRREACGYTPPSWWLASSRPTKKSR